MSKSPEGNSGTEVLEAIGRDGSSVEFKYPKQAIGISERVRKMVEPLLLAAGLVFVAGVGSAACDNKTDEPDDGFNIELPDQDTPYLPISLWNLMREGGTNRFTAFYIIDSEDATGLDTEEGFLPGEVTMYLDGEALPTRTIDFEVDSGKSMITNEDLLDESSYGIAPDYMVIQFENGREVMLPMFGPLPDPEGVTDLVQTKVVKIFDPQTGEEQIRRLPELPEFQRVPTP